MKNVCLYYSACNRQQVLHAILLIKYAKIDHCVSFGMTLKLTDLTYGCGPIWFNLVLSRWCPDQADDSFKWGPYANLWYKLPSTI